MRDAFVNHNTLYFLAEIKPRAEAVTVTVIRIVHSPVAKDFKLARFFVEYPISIITALLRRLGNFGIFGKLGVYIFNIPK